MTASENEFITINFSSRDTGPRSSVANLTIDLKPYLDQIPIMLDAKNQLAQENIYLNTINELIEIAKTDEATPKEELIKLNENRSESEAKIEYWLNIIHKFKTLKEQIFDEVLGEFTCLPIFDNGLVTRAFNSMIPPLSDEEKERVTNSTAMHVFRANFKELLKNSIDVIITQSMKGDDKKEMSIDLSIDLSVDDQVSIRLSDNGPGLPRDLLEKLSDKESIIKYCQKYKFSETTTKRNYSGEIDPCVYGGQGLGLRIFLLHASTGQNIEEKNFKPKYKLEESDHLEIENLEGGGASFTFTTSLRPVYYFKNHADEEEEEVILTSVIGPNSLFAKRRQLELAKKLELDKTPDSDTKPPKPS